MITVSSEVVCTLLYPARSSTCAMGGMDLACDDMCVSSKFLCVTV